MTACATCGEDFAANARGRPAVHCPACRKPRSGRGDESANGERAQEQRRRKRASTGEARIAADADRLRRVALALSAESDDGRAVSWAGVEASEPAVLAGEARAAFPELADPGDMRAVGRMLRAAMGLAALQLWRRLPEVPPGQLAGVLRALSDAQEAIGEANGATAYATINLTVIGPDGVPLAL